jgi:hypothetical protein
MPSVWAKPFSIETVLLPILQAVTDLVIVRRFHVRIGDRVQIAGVSGEVANLGLFQLELSEIDAGTEKRTGHVVFFSNSYVFVSPATSLFR